LGKGRRTPLANQKKNTPDTTDSSRRKMALKKTGASKKGGVGTKENDPSRKNRRKTGRGLGLFSKKKVSAEKKRVKRRENGPIREKDERGENVPKKMP